VLSIGVATPLSAAAMSLAQHCLNQVQQGCVELPNLRKKTGGKVNSINFASVPRKVCAEIFSRVSALQV
jgi:hypothetical protein